MKKVSSVIALSVALVLVISCSDSKDRYVDLSTGNAFEPIKDDQTGIMMDKETKKPVYLYVDSKNNDTIYGKTGEVVNGHVISENNKYVYDGDVKVEMNNDGSVKYKDDDQKIEIEKDGDIKIKDGDKKIKIDGETGERKVKNDN
ncbi:MAG: hypothetical protein ABIP79_13900 [Chitinophagaceae bacterium]